ncbi:MAG: hypothetical protein PHC53_05185 [Patescibacteria group bacterium]|nr:hypothetical protein [Patescibacteria group bacterium]
MPKHKKASSKNLFLLPLAVIIVSGFAWATVGFVKDNTALAAGKMNTYKDANITLQYPQWKAVDTSESPFKDSLLAAVSDGNCAFMLITAPLPAGSTLKDFLEATVAEQSKQPNVKFVTKIIADDHFEIDVIAPTDTGNKLRQYAYGVLGSNHSIYQLTFVSNDSNFNKACKPSTKTSVKSIKLLNPPSEKGDAQKLSEYFKSITLGKLALGKKVSPPKVVPIKTTAFTSKDQFCITLNVKKDIPVGVVATALYSVELQQNIKDKEASTDVTKAGSISSCGSLTGLPYGRYEVKIYVDDVLAGVYPFTYKK